MKIRTLMRRAPYVFGALLFAICVAYSYTALSVDEEQEDLSDELCITCHPDVDMQTTAHEEKVCIDCHTDVTEIPHETDPMRINCTLCHVSMGGASMGMDVHSRAREAGNLNAPDCATCHGSHDIAPGSSSESPMKPQNMRSFCLTCHSDTEIRDASSYHQSVLLNKMVCQGCHDANVKNDSPKVDYEQLKNSIHGVLECVDCHRDIEGVPHMEKLETVNCGNCHEGAKELYGMSVHGIAKGEGIEEAPNCQDCHGSHGILSGRSEESRIYPTNISETCGNGACHANPEMAEKFDIPISNPYIHYSKSIHAKKLKEGNLESATCSKCHGSHDIQPLGNPRSPVFKGNIPKTCSKCHDDMYEEFVQSAHWKGYLRGVREAPVCTDCHLEHEIVETDNPKSSVFASKVPNLCTDCHENARISERYGIPVMRLETYLKSYHGLAQQAGNYEAANCISCHEKHKILEPTNPESSVNPVNLGKTCGKCHPGVTDTMQVIKIHRQDPGIGGKVIDIARRIYIVLIVVSVIGMLIFTYTDLRAKTRRGEVGLFSKEADAPKKYVRFTFAERVIHFIIFVSFVALVYSGFAHKYPEALWAYPLSKWLPFTFRDNLHRVAGVALIVVTIVQFVLIPITKRGRSQLAAIFPRLKDASDALNLFSHNLNPKNPAPKIGRFSFIEKFEFWAFMWGSILMGVTGLGMWFKDFTLMYFPKWVMDFFLTLHFYEAVLASLAILIWHFYWTIFNPHIYPMDRSWLSGEISEERLEEEHTLEWDQIKEKEKKAEEK